MTDGSQATQVSSGQEDAELLDSSLPSVPVEQQQQESEQETFEPSFTEAPEGDL